MLTKENYEFDIFNCFCLMCHLSGVLHCQQVLSDVPLIWGLTLPTGFV